MKRHPKGRTMKLTKHQEEICRLDEKELACQIISCDKGPQIDVILDKDNKCYNRFSIHFAFYVGEKVKNMSIGEHRRVAELAKCMWESDVSLASPGAFRFGDIELTHYRISHEIMFGARIMMYQQSLVESHVQYLGTNVYKLYEVFMDILNLCPVSDFNLALLIRIFLKIASLTLALYLIV